MSVWISEAPVADLQQRCLFICTVILGLLIIEERFFNAQHSFAYKFSNRFILSINDSMPRKQDQDALGILKLMLQNFKSILKKCLLGTGSK